MTLLYRLLHTFRVHTRADMGETISVRIMPLGTQFSTRKCRKCGRAFVGLEE